MLGMVISPLMTESLPYYWVDDHPLLYGNNGSIDPGTYIYIYYIILLYSYIILTDRINNSRNQRAECVLPPFQMAGADPLLQENGASSLVSLVTAPPKKNFDSAVFFADYPNKNI